MGPFIIGLAKTYYTYKSVLNLLIIISLVLLIYGLSLFQKMKAIDNSHETSN